MMRGDWVRGHMDETRNKDEDEEEGAKDTEKRGKDNEEGDETMKRSRGETKQERDNKEEGRNEQQQQEEWDEREEDRWEDKEVEGQEDDNKEWDEQQKEEKGWDEQKEVEDRRKHKGGGLNATMTNRRQGQRHLGLKFPDKMMCMAQPQYEDPTMTRKAQPWCIGHNDDV